MPRPSRFRSHVAALCLLPCLAAARAADVTDTDTLTTIAAVQLLTAEQAAQGRPVELTGVIIVADFDGFILHDGRNGVYVRSRHGEVPDFGERVAVRGATNAGDYAPAIHAQALQKLGPGDLPQPMAVTARDLATGRLDCQWIELEGVVRRVWSAPAANQFFPAFAEIMTDAGRLEITFCSIVRAEAERWIDARVRIRAACLHYFNTQRQFYGVRLVVSGMDAVDVLEPAPDPWTQPVRPLESLHQFSPNANYDRRVHVEGVVTCVTSATSFYIAASRHGMLVKSEAGIVPKLGDTVAVAGFVARGARAPLLEDAIVRSLPRSARVAPRSVDAASALDAEGQLVTIEGQVVQNYVTPEESVILLAAGDQVFAARLYPPAARTAELPDPGSVVSVTGVSEPVMDDHVGVLFPWKPTSFHLVLRTLDDVRVLKRPPWWTLTHILIVSIAVVSVALAIVGVLWLRSRLRVQQQRVQRAASEAEFAAILKERTRIAREMHDTHAQGLTALNMQLELARAAVDRSPAEARSHIDTAGQLARASLEEARRSIRAMRSQLLDQRELPDAVEAAGRQLLRGSEVRFAVHVEGERRRLPQHVECELLRITLEGITNALKHALPRRVESSFAYGDDVLEIAIRDDGRGFTPRNGRVDSYGLAGMRERAQQIGGTLQVVSELGRGTAVIVSVPIGADHV